MGNPRRNVLYGSLIGNTDKPFMETGGISNASNNSWEHNGIICLIFKLEEMSELIHMTWTDNYGNVSEYVEWVLNHSSVLQVILIVASLHVWYTSCRHWIWSQESVFHKGELLPYGEISWKVSTGSPCCEKIIDLSLQSEHIVLSRTASECQNRYWLA